MEEILSKSRTELSGRFSQRRLELAFHRYQKVNAFFQKEQPFMNCKLKIEDVCEVLQMSPRTLSASLRKNGYRNFVQFVNHFRVEEAKHRMAMPENDRFTLEAIAEMAGFGTRQAFYDSFEKMTGIKPARYRRMIKKERKENGVALKYEISYV
jgi:AraC-like DNA-binding protein